ncbi:hypothetical protein B0H14DRAFT_2588507 [Mycena olivaceomarginata]|nr:hypothetical protein B0H14DRAFT_2588507 [Mycena olivaceomarginata]
MTQIQEGTCERLERERDSTYDEEKWSPPARIGRSLRTMYHWLPSILRATPTGRQRVRADLGLHSHRSVSPTLLYPMYAPPLSPLTLLIANNGWPWQCGAPPTGISPPSTHRAAARCMDTAGAGLHQPSHIDSPDRLARKSFSVAARRAWQATATAHNEEATEHKDYHMPQPHTARALGTPHLVNGRKREMRSRCSFGTKATSRSSCARVAEIQNENENELGMDGGKGDVPYVSARCQPLVLCYDYNFHRRLYRLLLKHLCGASQSGRQYLLGTEWEAKRADPDLQGLILSRVGEPGEKVDVGTTYMRCRQGAAPRRPRVNCCMAWVGTPSTQIAAELGQAGGAIAGGGASGVWSRRDEDMPSTRVVVDVVNGRDLPRIHLPAMEMEGDFTRKDFKPSSRPGANFPPHSSSSSRPPMSGSSGIVAGLQC